ncbi:hypothetical protein [Bacillus sp. FJAT-45350]|uniref:hypothetical protein n=1 Tax=Bacillus sp. FJAT-45350 TaxID=2011014 RepID=UPI000BB728A8|nr:hypothetical protein [Bacillus sp. FJAT-45350]
MYKIVVLFILILVVTGCQISESKYPEIKHITTNNQEVENYKNYLGAVDVDELSKVLLKEHDIVLMSYIPLLPIKVNMDIRKLGEFETKLTSQEKEGIRETITNFIGLHEVTVELEQFTIKENSNITGEILDIDYDKNKILIVEVPTNNKFVWITPTDDAFLSYKGIEKPFSFKEIEIGQRVSVWYVGPKVLTNPGKGTALKIIIE